MKTCNQQPFSKRIAWRNRYLWALLVLMLVYMVIIGELGLGDSREMNRLAEIISRVIFFGGMLWVISKIVRNGRMLADKRQMKEQLLWEQDERNRRLHEKTGGLVWDAMLVCLLFATLTASLTNMAAFHTALALLAAALALKLGAYLHYRHRC